MGWFSSKKKAEPKVYRPMASDAMTTEQWQKREASLGCVVCLKVGCHRMNHSYSMCPGCNSPYCNGNGCPGRRGRVRNCPNCGRSPHRGRC